MRKSTTTAVLAVGLSLAAGCSSTPDVDDAVRAYTSAYLAGDGAKAHALLSTRCQAAMSPSELGRHAAGAATFYGRARITSLTSSVDGDRATVTYRFDQPAIDQEDQPWVLESGAWRYDQC